MWFLSKPKTHVTFPALRIMGHNSPKNILACIIQHLAVFSNRHQTQNRVETLTLRKKSNLHSAELIKRTLCSILAYYSSRWTLKLLDLHDQIQMYKPWTESGVAGLALERNKFNSCNIWDRRDFSRADRKVAHFVAEKMTGDGSKLPWNDDKQLLTTSRNSKLPANNPN